MDILQKKIAFCGQNKKYLPQNFCECEYLESTGSQWIDTLVHIRSEIYFKIKFMFLMQGSGIYNCNEKRNQDRTEEKLVFSIYENYFSSEFSFIRNSVVYNKAVNYRSGPVVLNKEIVNEIGFDFAALSEDGLEKKQYKDNLPEFESAKTLQLFRGYRWNDVSNYIYTKCRMYSVVLGHSKIPRFSLTPAICTAGTRYTDAYTGDSIYTTTDKPGMFEVYSQRFFVNKGTGADFLYQLKQ